MGRIGSFILSILVVVSLGGIPVGVGGTPTHQSTNVTSNSAVATSPSLELTAANQTATPGGTVTVTYTIKNVGTTQETSLLFEPTATPSAVSIKSVNASAATTIQGQTAFFTDLTAGSTYQVSVTYNVSASIAPGNYSLDARTKGNSGANDTITTILRVKKSVVPIYDSDQSGTIDNQELLSALADYQVTVSNRDLLELLAVYDDGDDSEDKPPVVSIQKLNENPDRYYGETVRVQGIFHGTQQQALITSDYKRTLQRRPVPPSKFLPLSFGGEPMSEQLSSSDEGRKLTVTATVKQQRESIPDPAGSKVYLSVESLDLGPVPSDLEPLIPRPDDPVWDIPTTPTLPEQGECSFAVIINGGISASQNSKAFWRDAEFEYRTMNQSFNIPDENIYVHNLRGGNPNQVLGRNVVDNDSKQASIEASFEKIEQKAAACQENFDIVNPQLYVFGTNHGTNFDPEGMNLVGSQVLTPRELRNLTRDARRSGVEGIRVMLDICYSGQFINARSDQPNTTLVETANAVATASQNNQLAYTGPSGYGSHTYHFVAALAGQYPNGTSVSADADGDGIVEWDEAQAYATPRNKLGPKGTGQTSPQFFNQTFQDADGDGIEDTYDTQPKTANPDQ